MYTHLTFEKMIRKYAVEQSRTRVNLSYLDFCLQHDHVCTIRILYDQGMDLSNLPSGSQPIPELVLCTARYPGSSEQPRERTRKWRSREWSTPAPAARGTSWSRKRRLAGIDRSDTRARTACDTGPRLHASRQASRA